MLDRNLSKYHIIKYLALHDILSNENMASDSNGSNLEHFYYRMSVK